MSHTEKTAIAMAVALTLGTSAVLAEVSGNVALSTDYVWRGISQTDNQAAISGGLDYGHESGFYLGTWASNVDFKTPSGDPSVEIDIYAGFAGELGNGLGYDLGVIHYDYPSADELDFEEFYVGLSYSIASFQVSHDFENDNTYYDLGASYEFMEGLSLSAHVGRYDLDGGTDYTDYNVGVSTTLADVDFALMYTDTDLNEAECGGNICDDRVVFSIGKGF